VNAESWAEHRAEIIERKRTEEKLIITQAVEAPVMPLA